MVPFTGSGLWQPEADKLALLREDIDHNSHRLKAVLQRPDMRREFFNGIPDDEKKAVQAFVSQNKESALKTKPKVSTALPRCSIPSFGTHQPPLPRAQSTPIECFRAVLYQMGRLGAGEVAMIRGFRATPGRGLLLVSDGSIKR